MERLLIDIETYSEADLGLGGVYRYASDPSFRILLFSYSVDGGDVRCVDLEHKEAIPAEILAALADPAVIKAAYNAMFERVCLSFHLYGCNTPYRFLDPAQWECLMVKASNCGLPMSLSDCCAALGLDEGKMEEGRSLIQLFSTPQGRKRLDEGDLFGYRDSWEKFRRYNRQDVIAEMRVDEALAWHKDTKFERHAYAADQRINDRGVRIDLSLARNAADFAERFKSGVAAEMRRLIESTPEGRAMAVKTGRPVNASSPAQLREWIIARTGDASMNSIGQDVREELIESTDDDVLREVLMLRRESGKSTTAKYKAMLDCVCADGRARGLLQFCGAGRSGRWSGRLVQLQNLHRNSMDDIGLARDLVKDGCPDDFANYFASPVLALSELVRTAVCADDGMVLSIGDLSAIEARVLAWVAGEQWVLTAFEEGKDIYCETASRMYHMRVEKDGINSGLRAKGKVAVLALGYAGGVNALDAMGGKKMRMSDVEKQNIVTEWRLANPHITAFWRNVENAFKTVAAHGGERFTGRVNFRRAPDGSGVLVGLPSGRDLCYRDAKYERSPRGRMELSYMGVNQTTRKWERIWTHGGKLTENIVQAVARDLLAFFLVVAEDEGLRPVFHVHDEIIAENSKPLSFAELFRFAPPWTVDLPMNGSCHSSPYYLKY